MPGSDLDVAVWPDGVSHGSGILAELTGTQHGNILQAQGNIGLQSAGARQTQQQTHLLFPGQSRHMQGIVQHNMRVPYRRCSVCGTRSQGDTTSNSMPLQLLASTQGPQQGVSCPQCCHPEVICHLCQHSNSTHSSQPPAVQEADRTAQHSSALPTSMRLTAALFMSAEKPWSLNTVRPSFRVSWNQSRHVTLLPAHHTHDHKMQHKARVSTAARKHEAVCPLSCMLTTNTSKAKDSAMWRSFDVPAPPGCVCTEAES